MLREKRNAVYAWRQSKIALPNCNHRMCQCYRVWRTRSQSCPFCRDSRKRVNTGDLWVYTDSGDIVDMATVMRENIRRLFIYVDKLPVLYQITFLTPMIPTQGS